MTEKNGSAEIRWGADPVAVGAEAIRLVESGMKCAEAVLSAMARREGVQSHLIPGIATGFCGGIGRSGNLCGSVSGAVMGLGLTLGRSDTAESVAPIYNTVHILLDRFVSEFGSTNCTELLGCNLGTEEGRQQFNRQGLSVRCAAYTRRAAELAAELAETSRTPGSS